jgi:hypothetical protein
MAWEGSIARESSGHFNMAAMAPAVLYPSIWGLEERRQSRKCTVTYTTFFSVFHTRCAKENNFCPAQFKKGLQDSTAF